MNYKANTPKKIAFLKIIRTLLLTAGIFFIAVLISQGWQEIRHILKETKPGLFLLSILFAVTGNLILSILFRNSLRKYGHEITIRMTNKLFFYGQIAKYVPGKIWSIVLQKSFLEKAGSTSGILFSNIDLLAISIIINATIALCLILFNISLVFPLLIYVTGGIACLIVSKSRYMSTAARFILPKFRRLERNPPLRQDTLSNTFIVLSYCAIWFFYLTAWFLVLSASFGLSIREASGYIAFLGLSWIVGILAFFVPAGMGVREGIFILLAKHAGIDVTIETLVSIAVITRLWLIIQEIGGASIIFLRNLTKNAFPK